MFPGIGNAYYPGQYIFANYQNRDAYLAQINQLNSNPGQDMASLGALDKSFALANASNGINAELAYAMQEASRKQSKDYFEKRRENINNGYIFG